MHVSLFQSIQQTWGAKQSCRLEEGYYLISAALASAVSLHCQDNQHVDQWNFNNMYLSVMGIVTQLLYWSGHSGTQ